MNKPKQQRVFSEADRLRKFMDVEMAAFFYCYNIRTLRLMCTRGLVPGAHKPASSKEWRIPVTGMDELMRDGVRPDRRVGYGKRCAA